MNDMLGGRSVRRTLTVLLAVGLLLAACGDDDGGGSEAAGNGSGEDSDALDVCALLSDSEIESLLGVVLVSEPTGPDAPFPGCSWQTGRLIVQVASGDTVVLAPDQECPALEIGDEAVACPGSVQFVSSGSRVHISTIEDVTEDQLIAVAEVLLPKIEAAS